MSYADFDKGTSSSSLVMKRSFADRDQDDLLGRFKECERRLTVLRLFTGGDHEPTEEEMIKWLEAIKRK